VTIWVIGPGPAAIILSWPIDPRPRSPERRARERDAAPSPGSFLLGTALRVAADVRRTLCRRREVPEEEGAEAPSLDPAPDELAHQRQLRAQLDGVLAAMPDDLRVVFVLYELEEMSTPEIAALLEIPLGTAASRLRRAREAFDRLVARIQTGGPG
jgi:RNA polymerase sigma-70 factor (ECF subfamily)